MLVLLSGAAFAILGIVGFARTNRNYTVHQAIKNYSNSLLPKIMFVIGFFLLYSKLTNMHGTRSKSEIKLSSLKYILTCTSEEYYTVSILKTGQEAFVESNCPVANCYVTHNRNFFGSEDNITMFDAIIFNGDDIKNKDARIELPGKRSPKQIYIFNDMESGETNPVCDPIFDGFFNWTATYKLNSDVVYSYITIWNNKGDIIGPRVDMTWIDPMSEVNSTFRNNLSTKSKAVAWFVSHCKTIGKRENYARNLKRELEKLSLNLDIYGSCGDKVCRRFKLNICDNMLKEDYYFYLSFENSIIEDYITEKLLTALMNDNVPIVYGGANFSRFLPPGSYIDARQHTPEQLAAVIDHLIKNPTEYYDFFRWKNHYRYNFNDPNVGSSNLVCKLCAALNDEEKLVTPQVYQDFRRWWNPNYLLRCK